ncbi:MAG TPA: IS1595 family transposase [Candidatus Cybelea sp.]|jgi:transposase-like protein
MPARKPKISPEPATLREAVVYFGDLDRAHDFVMSLRFPNGLACPRYGCGSANVGFVQTRRLIQCKDCKKQSSLKVGTIFEDSPIGFDKWLPAMWMIGGDRNGISSHELGRAIGVTQKTAWFMLHRIRLAMKDKSIEKPFTGEVEADETFIGAKAKLTWNKYHTRKVQAHGPATDKAVVFGIAERGNPSQVRAMVVPDYKKSTLAPILTANVAKGSTLYTDALRSYRGLEPHFVHAFVDHMIEYVNGRVHTNTIENFWSCLKRTINGTYICPKTFHMEAYVDEQAWRFNNRELADSARLNVALEGVEGKRITYKELKTRNATLRAQAARKGQ